MNDRYIDISSKLLRMGKALSIEGDEKKDYRIKQMGNFLTFISTMILKEEDTVLFSQIVAMFSAKSMIETLEKTDDEFNELLKKKFGNKTYDDLINDLNKLRDNDNKD